MSNSSEDKPLLFGDVTIEVTNGKKVTFHLTTRQWMVLSSAVMGIVYILTEYGVI